MPAAVRRVLEDAGVLTAYRERPPYQRNDWLGWIARAKQPETRARRLAEMLDDLRRGGRYMGMQWRPRRRKD